jgi:gamma-glutamyltranspeptidase / glutathione hydrolase / leukotriene-C4 hydrolase
LCVTATRPGTDQCNHDFNLDNYPEPFKRPLSSIVPAIVEHRDGSFYLAIGGAGGSRIFPAVFQTMLNLDWGLDLSQAVEFGRLHDQLYPITVDADDFYPGDILYSLKQMGHNITGDNSQLSVHGSCVDPGQIVEDVNHVGAVVQAVMRKDGRIFGECESLGPLSPSGAMLII